MSFSCKKLGAGWAFLWTFDADNKPSNQHIEKAIKGAADNLGLPLENFTIAAIKEEQDRDWLAESYQALSPLHIGAFFVYGSHYTGVMPADKIPLMIEAATAFGSGEHGTTSRCMLAIEDVKNKGFQPRNILDMGCGSGILAAVAAKLWPDVPVFAADNDLECVIVTGRHIKANDISNIQAYQSEGYAQTSDVWANAPYDFIIANILAGPLIEMAPEQSKALASGGYLILSGTLKEQAERVLAAYTPHGLSLAGEFPGDEWMTLLLQKA